MTNLFHHSKGLLDGVDEIGVGPRQGFYAVKDIPLLGHVAADLEGLLGPFPGLFEPPSLSDCPLIGGPVEEKLSPDVGTENESEPRCIPGFESG